MIPGFDVEWSVFQHVLISLGIGAIVGLERQTHQSDEDRVRNGVRTFALASLLGTVAALLYHFSAAVATAIGAGFFALIVAHYVVDARYQGKVTGITTETAALIVFGLGAMVPMRPLLAASIAVLVALVLNQKKWIHQSVERMTKAEIFATIKLLVVTLVFLPLLPTDPVDPWGIYVLRDIWFLVVLISAISFIGYFAMKMFGSQKGIAITGLLGGLASSTAVTLAMAAREKEGASDAIRKAAAFAIVAANAIMLVRVYVEVIVVDPTLALPAAPVLGTMFAGAVLGAVVSYFGLPGASHEAAADPDDSDEGFSPTNPFRLVPALKFGVIFVVIIGLAHALREVWGESGFYVASILGGLADSDATVLTAARLHERGSIDASTAVRAIVLAVVSNSLVKIGLAAFLGSFPLGARVLVALIPLLVAAGAGAFLFV